MDGVPCSNVHCIAIGCKRICHDGGVEGFWIGLWIVPIVVQRTGFKEGNAFASPQNHF